MEQLLDSIEVARLLRISRSQAYVLMRQGMIPVIRLGRSVRVRQQDLEELVARLRSPDDGTVPNLA
jgi:excisionase family DNA binding protein